MSEYIDDAIERYEEQVDEPMSLSEFVESVIDNPVYGCSGAEYLFRAIEYYGTREVTEHGEDLERYRFFDDPANDGEHAILGHTVMLNDFVEDLRQQAVGDGNKEKIFWFEGPTATGKSEIKRCIIAGLTAFSKTDEGKRYTIEWNAKTRGSDGARYIDSGTIADEDVDRDWFQSPVQSNPLSVLPEETRRSVMDDAGIANADRLSKVGLDPFSQEALDLLEKEYGRDPEAYEKILSDDHLRVVRYTVEPGTGIGVLQSEDEGTTQNLLAGSWMKPKLKEYDSRGRRDPRAFSFDGVISQGNSGVSIIEDAINHRRMLSEMLNVVDDDVMKIDRRNRMPIDTVFIIISNKQLHSELSTKGLDGEDGFKPLRRRLARYKVPYLLNYSDEVELLHRLLTGEKEIWGNHDEDRVRQPVTRNDCELAPHTLFAVALYEVISRMNRDVHDTLSLPQRAELYEHGSIIEDDEHYTIEDSEQHAPREAGQNGIPCTHSRDVLADLMSENDLVMPHEAVGRIADDLDEVTVFDLDDTDSVHEMTGTVNRYVMERQEEDVIEAMLEGEMATEKQVEEYVEHVFCWATDEDTVDPDPHLMKVFETERLGLSTESYDGVDPNEAVEAVRRDEIVQGISTWIYENADDDWTIDMSDAPLSEIPVLEDLLGDNSWEDVLRVYENFDPAQWDDPLEGTETEELKAKTINNMQSMMDYSEQSAERTSSLVLSRLSVNRVVPDDGGDTWDVIEVTDLWD